MDDILSRQVPQSLEAEQSVLGSMLIDSRCVGDVIGILKPEDFYLRQNQEIFEVIYSMFSFSRPIDPVTVLNELKENGHYEESVTPKYIRQLMETTPTAANVKQYARIVSDKALLRNIAQAATDIDGMVREEVGTAADILEASERKIFSLAQGRGETLERIGTVLVQMFDSLNERANSGEEFPGVTTGLHDLDKKINGLNKSDLIIIAARPGMGKTSLALNMLTSAAKASGKTAVFFSLEMSREQLALRLVSNESFVDNSKLVTGKLSEEEWRKIGIAGSALSQTDIRVSDNPSITVAEMNAICRRLDNLGLVIIDYLQLMTSASGKESENRATTVSEISRSLKIMAKELNVPVICLSQLNRGAEGRSDKRPTMAELRESGAIEQDADQIILIYRDDYYNENSPEKNVAELNVAKNRHGEPGVVKVQWMPTYYTFSDLDWKHSD